jgi:ribosome-binding factor A
VGHRLLRINERIKEIVSAAIAGEVKDPRVGFVTVTGVETSSDLRHAKVFVSVLGSQAQREETLEALRQSRGLLQSSINAGLRMKRTPQITFIYDPTTDQAQHIERLIRREEAELEALRPREGEAGEPAPGEGTPAEDETGGDEADEKAGA